jgi:hypothetical protein
MMRRRVIKAGWGLAAFGMVVLAVVVTAGGFRARSDEAFNRWVGWATIWALVVAAIGVLLAVWDKVLPADHGEAGAAGIEGRLVRIVLAEAVDLRSRLIGAGEIGDQSANVRFVKTRSRFREVGGARSGDLLSVLAYYRSLSPERLVIMGGPGAGKTVLAIELQVLLLEERERDDALPIPVLISAARYDSGQGWQVWLAGHLALRFSISKAAAVRLVTEGRILPVVDGLDEMDAPGAGQGTRMRALVTALNASLQGRQRAPVVVTCRPAEYAALGRGIDRATHVEMVPLDGDEAAGYLREQFLDQDEEYRWAPVLSALHRDPAGPVAGRLATPWQLTLALAAFRDGGEPIILLATPADTPDTVDQQLLGQFIANAVGLHDTAGRYQLAAVRRWLTALSSGLARQASRGGSATDIELATWWAPTAGQPARLVHSAPSMMLAAAFVYELVNTRSDGWTIAIPLAAIALIPFALGIMAARPPVPRRPRTRQLASATGLRGIARGLVLGLGSGLFFGLVLGLSTYFAADAGNASAANASAVNASRGSGLLGLGIGLVLGVGAGLASGLSDAAPQPVGPRDVIRAERRYLVTFEVVLLSVLGLVFGVVGGVIVGYSDAGRAGLRPASWPAFWAGFWPAALSSALEAILVGLVYGLWFWAAGMGSRGSSAWTRYHIAVVINWMRGRAPLRFGAFLDWAHDAGLLRVSGVAYQFRHRQLQDSLTPPSSGRTGLAPIACGAHPDPADVSLPPPAGRLRWHSSRSRPQNLDKLQVILAIRASCARTPAGSRGTLICGESEADG